MKTSLRTFLISFLITMPLIICSCGGGNKQSNDLSIDETHGLLPQAKEKLLLMRVPEIPCSSCKGKVEGVLKSANGIVNFKVFLKDEQNHNVVVVYDPALISVDQIKNLITGLNKTVENVTEK